MSELKVLTSDRVDDGIARDMYMNKRWNLCGEQKEVLKN